MLQRRKKQTQDTGEKMKEYKGPITTGMDASVIRKVGGGSVEGGHARGSQGEEESAVGTEDNEKKVFPIKNSRRPPIRRSNTPQKT
jgi:hypothetical protein